MTTDAVNHTEIRNKDLLALRHYITAKDDTQYENVHHSTVLLDLTHSNLQQKHVEIRFDKHDSLAVLRQRIHQKTGTAPHFQQLIIKQHHGNNGEQQRIIPPDTPDHYPLGYFGLEHHGMEVHCMDLNPSSGSAGGQYEDVSLIDKYRMSDEDYQNRKGTLRDWATQQKAKDATFTLAKHAKEHREMVDAQKQHRLGLPLPQGFFVDSAGTLVREEEKEDIGNGPSQPEIEAVDPLFAEESIQGISVGDRCQVAPGKRRGFVQYVGTVPELGPGYWVGVVFDEPVGKTDGTTPTKEGQERRRYFDALERHGGFIRAKNMQVGDFPERDLFDDENDSDEDEL